MENNEEQLSQAISKKVGLPPGTLIHVGSKKSEHVSIELVDYSKTQYSRKPLANPEDCKVHASTETTSWINICGLHQVDKIASIGEQFGLHKLLVEDVLNTKQRPKLEVFEDHLFVTVKMIGLKKKGKSIISEQVSFVLGDTWILTFQEIEGDLFDGIRERLKDPGSVLRDFGPDYLLYRLIDTIIDNYYHVAEHFSDASEKLEDRALRETEREIVLELQHTKRSLLKFRKAVVPIREVITRLQRDESKFITDHTRRYLHDVYDHILHISESVEAQREVLSTVVDLHMSGVSNKMNKIMQVLTVISSIFIPLTFLAGIYGMNFEHIPELKWEYGYTAFWCLIVTIFIGMLIYFKRRKWL